MRWPCSIVGVLALVGCSLITDLDGLTGAPTDAGDAAEAIAAKDFSISITPSTVAIAPGQSVTFTVNVQRFGSFTTA
jgi:plastocyanin